MDTTTADAVPAIHPSSAISSMCEMPVSPASVASSTHFPFPATEMSGMGMDTSALDTAFTSDVASSVGLQLGYDAGPGNSRDSIRSLDQIQWTFSLSDLTADLSNLGGMLHFMSNITCVFLWVERYHAALAMWLFCHLFGIFIHWTSDHYLSEFADLGALGNYPGSPFQESDPEILLDSPGQEDIGTNCCQLLSFFFFPPTVWFAKIRLCSCKATDRRAGNQIHLLSTITQFPALHLNLDCLSWSLAYAIHVISWRIYTTFFFYIIFRDLCQVIMAFLDRFPVEEFFVDSIPGPPNSQSDEEKSWNWGWALLLLSLDR